MLKLKVETNRGDAPLGTRIGLCNESRSVLGLSAIGID